uniref:Uncharacterized protein n=1 Tax=Melopsittacus undulatus TaxID=13146 RepID=A0A8V5GKG6_MELUD
MAQWQEVQNLANAYLEQIHQLYAGAALPMAVRQSLAAWIEDQNWKPNAPSGTSRTCRMPLTSASRCTMCQVRLSPALSCLCPPPNPLTPNLHPQVRTGPVTPSTCSRSKSSRPSCRSWTGSGG